MNENHEFANFKRPFYIQTDVSDKCIGAVLSQKDDDGKEYVIIYASRILHGNEKHWETR